MSQGPGTTRGLRDLLVVVNDLSPYGAQRVAVALVDEWVARGVDVTVVTIEDPTEGDLTLPEGVRRVQLRRRGGRARALVELTWQVRHVLRGSRPTAVLCHMNFANTIVLLAASRRFRRSAPVIVVEHNSLSKNLSVQGGGRVSGALFRRLHYRAAAVIGVSDVVVDDLRDNFGVPAGRLRRIYNPVPVRDATPDGPLHPWLAPDRAGTTLVCLAGLRRAKGQDLLIDALALLREDAAEAPLPRVLLLGDGPLRAELAARAVERGVDDVVHFAGYREDAPAWLAAADAMVLPSRWDSFGLVAVEAAALGVPVVAADVPGLNEVVPAHVPGWTVPSESPRALADRLGSLQRPVTAPSAPLGIGDFDPALVASRYTEVVLECVDALRKDLS